VRGVTIGADPDCDLVLPAAGPNRIALVQRAQLWLEVHAGEAGLADRWAEPRPAGERVQIGRRWSRIRIGDATVQLCRWPRRDEPLH
jgi:hypothetical protein